MAATLMAGFADQGGGIAITELDQYRVFAQGGERFQQVVDVEPDADAFNGRINADFFLSLFLLGIMRDDIEYAGIDVQFHAFELFIR